MWPASGASEAETARQNGGITANFSETGDENRLINNEIRISVGSLVEYAMKSGGLGDGLPQRDRLLEGAKLHRRLQRSRGEGYSAEVPLCLRFEYMGLRIAVEGRADGIFAEAGGVVIEEIKTTVCEPGQINENFNPMHWAQAACYGLMYSKPGGLDSILIQLTYLCVKSDEIVSFRRLYGISGLEDLFYPMLDKYLELAGMISQHRRERDSSIRELRFPFGDYRKGQKEMIRAVYGTISSGGSLFIQAPTGIGKTISTLYPAVKALGKGTAEKIFYLTARTTARQVAEEALQRMREQGLSIKAVTLTAKEKICFSGGAGCKPGLCPYADGYFDRINGAVVSVLEKEGAITRAVVEEYARRHRVCPFEYSLDIALSADCVICDYNYLFDPRVFLKRFFIARGNYIFLVDEAHNLLDRAREMFSAALSKKQVHTLRGLLGLWDAEIEKSLARVDSYLAGLRKLCEEEGRPYSVSREGPSELYPLLKEFLAAVDGRLSQNGEDAGSDELLDFYFKALAFIKISELYDQGHVTYVETQGSEVRLRLFCIDPSRLLREALKKGGSAIFFSATLTPLNYFRSILGGGEDSDVLELPSPFPGENLCLLIANGVSTKYRDRGESYGAVAEYIKAAIVRKTGNYMVYFPSYRYMNEVLVRFTSICPDTRILVQKTAMDETGRAAFLKRFKDAPDRSLVGFGVMGGVFSEGIDLKGDRLIGAVVVGAGLPQMNLEQNLIMGYFGEANGRGFEYAYMYPGMNKVLQAAGRVIRSEDDRGVVLLIDDRFGREDYQELFPDGWSHFEYAASPGEVEEQVDAFWDEN